MENYFSCSNLVVNSHAREFRVDYYENIENISFETLALKRCNFLHHDTKAHLKRKISHEVLFKHVKINFSSEIDNKKQEI